MSESSSEKSSIIDLDPNMRLNEQQQDGMMWLSPMNAPFRIAGFAWLEEEGVYRRLPVSPQNPIRKEVDILADCTAGGQIHFQTDSSALSIRVKLAGSGDMYHMPATGQCGFDCYIGPAGNLAYCSTTRFDHTQTGFESVLFESLDRQMRNIVLNFPLYQGVKEVWIGVDPDAEVIAASPFDSDRKIIVYGTSITQGGCATRPGMLYSNIMSRKIPYEFINLGFSGNGRGEPVLAHIIASIENPGLLILDYEANVSITEYRATLPEFIRIYREHHPVVPILVVSKIRYSWETVSEQAILNRLEYQTFAEETVNQRAKNGDAHIHYQEGGTLLGEQYWECTVDGVHPTDLGFLRMADALTPVVSKLI